MTARTGFIAATVAGRTDGGGGGPGPAEPDHHVAVAVGAADHGACGFEHLHDVGRGVAVGVGPHADDGLRGADGGQPPRVAGGGALVGHLEHVGVDGPELALGDPLDVAGEQRGRPGGGGEQDEGPVVGRGVPALRPEDLQGERPHRRPPPADGTLHRHARCGQFAEQAVDGAARDVRRHPGAVDAGIGGDPGQPGGVVGVLVRDDQEGDLVDPAGHERPPQHRRVGPAVDEHHRSHGVAQQDRVALADVEHHHLGPGGEPAGCHHGHRERHRARGGDERPQPSPERQGAGGGDAERGAPAQLGQVLQRPRHGEHGIGGGDADGGDRPEPGEHPDAPGGGRQGDQRRRQQVGERRQQRDRAEVRQQQRGDGHLGGGGGPQRRPRPAGPSVAPHAGPGEHTRRGGHAQLEPGVGGQAPRHSEQHRDRRSQRRPTIHRDAGEHAAEHHARHHRGTHHRRLPTGDHHEEGEAGEPGQRPAARAPAERAQRNPPGGQEECDVRPGDGHVVGEAGSPQRLGVGIGQRAHVADQEACDERGRRPRQEGADPGVDPGPQQVARGEQRVAGAARPGDAAGGEAPGHLHPPDPAGRRHHGALHDDPVPCGEAGSSLEGEAGACPRQPDAAVEEVRGVDRDGGRPPPVDRVGGDPGGDHHRPGGEVGVEAGGVPGPGHRPRDGGGECGAGHHQHHPGPERGSEERRHRERADRPGRREAAERPRPRGGAGGHRRPARPGGQAQPAQGTWTASRRAASLPSPMPGTSSRSSTVRKGP